jgi:hypothetical protein
MLGQFRKVPRIDLADPPCSNLPPHAVLFSSSAP